VVGTLPQYALESSITNKFWYGFEHGPQRAQAKVTDCTFQSLVSWYHLQDLSPVTAHTETLREFLQAASLFPGPLVANTRRRSAKSIDPFHFRYSEAAGPEIGQAKLQKENRNATPVSSNRLPVCRQVAENQTRSRK
jgi:hypothetical protein